MYGVICMEYNWIWTHANRRDAHGEWIEDDVPAGTKEGDRKGDDDQYHQPDESPQWIHARNADIDVIRIGLII